MRLDKKYSGANDALIESINGKPQALLKNFAYASGSPLNENDQDTIKSTVCLCPAADGLSQATTRK